MLGRGGMCGRAGMCGRVLVLASGAQMLALG